MQTCPKCGSRLKGYEVFCPNCGVDIAAYRQRVRHAKSKASDDDGNETLSNYLDRFENELNLGSTGNDTEHDRTVVSGSAESSSGDSPAEAKSTSSKTRSIPQPVNRQRRLSVNGYLTWWRRSFRHPLEVSATRSWFGWSSVVLNGLLWVLTFRFLMHQLVNPALTAFVNGRVPDNLALFENADGNWWGLLILAGLAILTSDLIGSGFRGKGTSPLAFGNRLAALTNVNLPISVLMLILAFLGFSGLAAGCAGLVLLIDGAGLFTAVLEPSGPGRQRFYFAVLALILVPVVTLVVFECLAQIIS